MEFLSSLFGMRRRRSATIRVLASQIQDAALRFAICAAVIAAITALYFRLVHVNPTTVALTLLVAVLIVAATWGLRFAVFTSLAATAAFNFFFLPPVGTFTIAEPQNWVALFAFLATAVVASHLSERARRETIAANQRRQEVERLYHFTEKMLVTENIFELLNAVPRARGRGVRRHRVGDVPDRTPADLLL